MIILKIIFLKFKKYYFNLFSKKNILKNNIYRLPLSNNSLDRACSLLIYIYIKGLACDNL